MKYLHIIINPTEPELRRKILDVLRSTTEHPAIVNESGELYLQLPDENALVSEVFSLGMSYAAALQNGFDDPFDFEIVQRRELPKAIAMAMN